MCLHTNSRQDPTNTSAARRKAFAEIRKRKIAALKEIRDYVDSIPHQVSEIPDGPVTNRRIYLYELRDRDTYRDIREIIERFFGTGGENPPTRWFMDAQIEEVVTRATTQEAERINRLAGAVGVSDPYQMERILNSPEFRERIRRVRSRVFSELKTFSSDVADDLAFTLGQQMARGVGIRTITGELTHRFDVKESDAQRVARSELGHAHRETRREQTKDARDRLGLNAMEQYISALSPTTRESHAELHLRIMTPEEIADFYADTSRSQGGEVNCLCSSQTVLVTDDGEIVGKREMTERDKREVARLTNKG